MIAARSRSAGSGIGDPRLGIRDEGLLIQYPPSPKGNAADVYHGVRVEDPYRWLEDPGQPETVAWVEAQNALTRAVLDGPVRDGLVERLTSLYDYPRTGVPVKRGDRYFFLHNTGLQDQPVLYVHDGVDGIPRVLIDPNGLSAPDGPCPGNPVALTAMEVNSAGTAVAYGLSTSGSDRQEIFVRDVETGVDLADHLQWAKFVAIGWVKDGSGFYYTRFPVPGTVPPGDEHYFNRVFYHRLGDPQERDALVFEKPAERETVFGVEISDDDRWIVITAFQAARATSSEIYLLDRGLRAGGNAGAALHGVRVLVRRSSRLPPWILRRASASSSEPTTAPRAAGSSRSIPCSRARRRWKSSRSRPTSCRPRCSCTARSSRRTCRTPAIASGCSISTAARPARSICRRSARSPPSAAGRPTTRCSSASIPSSTRRQTTATTSRRRSSRRSAAPGRR